MTISCTGANDEDTGTRMVQVSDYRLITRLGENTGVRCQQSAEAREANTTHPRHFRRTRPQVPPGHVARLRHSYSGARDGGRQPNVAVNCHS